MVIGAARPIKSRGLLGPAAGTGYPLTAPLLGGQPPLGVPGARLSSRANDAVIRPALALVLVTSGLKLLGIDNQLGLLVLALVLLAVPVWALDATLHPEPARAGAPVGRRMTVGVQLVGAPLDLGFVAALAYFGLLRPRLVAAVPTLPALAPPPAGSGSPAELRQRSPCQRHAG